MISDIFSANDIQIRELNFVILDFVHQEFQFVVPFVLNKNN